MIVKYHERVDRSHHKELVTYSLNKHEEKDLVGKFSTANSDLGTFAKMCVYY